MCFWEALYRVEFAGVFFRTSIAQRIEGVLTWKFQLTTYLTVCVNEKKFFFKLNQTLKNTDFLFKINKQNKKILKVNFLKKV